LKAGNVKISDDDNVNLNSGFDSGWETRYQNPSYRNHYPWSSVVSFVFCNRPKGYPPADIGIVEVGCGNGANLWFAAREGHRTAGIDGSPTAIALARQWFSREGLDCDFRAGNYTKLPFTSNSFDLAIDRAALSYAGRTDVARALSEVRRVLKPGGRLLFTPYSDRCTSFDGLPDADGCYRQVTRGSIVPGVQIRFYSLEDVRRELADGWTIKTLDHNEQTDLLSKDRVVHAEWHVIAEKL
jgi:ubiquinone/menaquinone biosynthesis C-methylase UbiE